MWRNAQGIDSAEEQSEPEEAEEVKEDPKPEIFASKSEVVQKGEPIESNPVPQPDPQAKRTSSQKVNVQDFDLDFTAARSGGAVYEKRRSSIHSDDIPTDPVAQQEMVMKMMKE